MLRGDLIRPLSELLGSHAATRPAAVAFDDGRRVLTYRDLERGTRRLAGRLAAAGLHPGDRAALLLGESTEMVEGYLAVPRAGGIAVPVSPAASDEELARLLVASGARLVLTDAAHRERLGRLDLGRPPSIVLLDGASPPGGEPDDAALDQPGLDHLGLDQLGLDQLGLDQLGLDEPAWMLYTAGTSGVPKGVVSTQRNCLWSIAAGYVPVLGLGPGDRVLWPLPLAHSFAHIACVLAVTATGASARIAGGRSRAEILRIWQEYRPTIVAGVPATWHRLTDAAASGGLDLPAPRVCLVGGAGTPPALRRRVAQTFAAPLVDAYGSTETCGSIAISWPGAAAGAASAGDVPAGDASGGEVPAGGEASCGLPVLGLALRLVDLRTGADVPDGAEGEVWVRGPNVMVGYHNQPVATAEALADGWFHTGDLARRDRAGFLTVTGRRTDLIVRAGENIHPAEIEQVLHAVSGVADVAVAGRVHEVLGEVPVAYVAAAPGGFDPAEALAVCRARLARGKVPADLYEVARIPRTPAGKIDRRLLPELPRRLRGVGDAYYSGLFRLDWVPRPSVRRAGPERWALVGPHAERLARAHLPGRAEISAHPDIAALIADLDAGLPPPSVALLGTGVREENGQGAGNEQGEDCPRSLRPWLRDPRLDGIGLTFVTRGAIRTGPGDPPSDPRGAELWAGLSALQAEVPGRLALADIEDEADLPLLPAALVEGGGEQRIAVRTGVVLVPRLERVATDRDRPGPPPFPGSGTTVLTGADTPTGAIVARHLAGAYGTGGLVLLTGPGRAAQVAAAYSGPAAAASCGSAATGADVVLAECDLTDPRATRRVLREVCPTPISAVIHVAAPGDRPADAEQALRHLYSATAPDRLSAFVVLAPPAGVLGLRGDEHSIAHAGVLDAATGWLREQGAPALCVGWGPSADDGTIGGLSEQVALEMLDAALTVGEDRLLALRLDPDAILAGGNPSILSALLG